MDLISNYDLVVHNIASLCLQRDNVPKYPIKFTFTTPQDMEHSVRTFFGDSEPSYRGDKWDVPLKYPPQGLGKLNGAALDVWAVVSTLMINCLRNAGHRAALKCCMSVETFKIVGYCFVDDSTIIKVSPSPISTT